MKLCRSIFLQKKTLTRPRSYTTSDVYHTAIYIVYSLVPCSLATSDDTVESGVIMVYVSTLGTRFMSKS